MPQVSIILPVYNVEKYLEQCLDSIIKQTFKDFECICVNDGSSDNSLSILEEYAKKDKRIKIISQKNKGLSGARNTGLKQATGEYVTFIDSDDWVSDKYIETLYNNITFCDYDIACAHHKIYFDNINDFILLKNNKNIVNKIKIVDLSRNVWNKIYKNAFLIKNNFYFFEDVFSGEDYSFNLLCFLYTDKVVFVDEFIYFYRKRNDSLTMSDEKIRTETAKSFMKAIEFLVKRNFNDKYFFKVFIKLLIYHLGKVSKNVSLKNKEIIINRAVLLINKIKNYSASIKFYEKFFINIILFLLKTLKFKSLIIFQALKNVV